MAIGKLTPYYHGKDKRRLDYIYTDEKSRFVVSVERNRKRRRRVCASLGEARYYASNLNLLFAEETPAQKIELLSDLIGRYKKHYEVHHSSPETVEAQCANLIRHLGNIPIDQIGPYLAPGYLSNRLGDGVGPKAANDDMRRLSALLTLARDDGILERNLLSGWKKLKEPTPRTRWLTYQEEERLLAECDEEFGRLVQIAILSGMRQAEQLTCRPSQILWESREIYLPKTKNGDARHVPMSKRLRELVRAQLEIGSEWLCPNRSRTNRWLKDNLRRRLNAVLARASIEDCTWHTFRHTFCSRLAMAGVPLRTIQILAGHKSIKTTERYAHLSDTHLHDEVKKLDRTTPTATPLRISLDF